MNISNKCNKIFFRIGNSIDLIRISLILTSKAIYLNHALTLTATSLKTYRVRPISLGNFFFASLRSGLVLKNLSVDCSSIVASSSVTVKELCLNQSIYVLFFCFNETEKSSSYQKSALKSGN